MNDRYLIVGLGSIGRRHLRNLQSLRENAQIGVLRRSPGRESAVAADYTLMTSMVEVTAFAPCAAIIAGPAPTHIPMARALVAQGVPVLIEKPLSHDLQGVRELALEAAERGVSVMVGYNLRFNRMLAAVRDAITAGVIGDVMAVRAEVGQYLPDWRPTANYRDSVSARQSLGGGALLELSHEIDYIYWMFGRPDHVTCRAATLSALDIDVEDNVDMCLEYDVPPRMITIHLDFLQRKPARSCKFIGSLGTLVWNGMDDRIDLELGEEASAQAPGYDMTPMSDRNDMYLDELRAFLHAIETGGPVPIGLAEGIDVMEILLTARRSIASGQTEPLVQAA